MKKVFVFFVCLSAIFSVFAAPKKDYDDYAQIIINDTPFVAKISLLNEETHFYEEYEIGPNEIVKLDQRLYVQGRAIAKKMIIKSSYIYISSYKFVTTHECVYLLKSIKRKVNQHSKDEELELEEDETEMLEEDSEVEVEETDEVEAVMPVEEVKSSEDFERQEETEKLEEMEISVNTEESVDFEIIKATEENIEIDENNFEENIEPENSEEYYVDENFMIETETVDIENVLITTDDSTENSYSENLLPEIPEPDIFENSYETQNDNSGIPDNSSTNDEDELLDLIIY